MGAGVSSEYQRKLQGGHFKRVGKKEGAARLFNNRIGKRVV